MVLFLKNFLKHGRCVTKVAMVLLLLLLAAVAVSSLSSSGAGASSCTDGGVNGATCIDSTAAAAAADRAGRRRRRLDDRGTRKAMLEATNAHGTFYQSPGSTGDAAAPSNVDDGAEEEEWDVAYEVSGSDVPAINGVYVRTDEWDGQPLFTNQGVTAVLYFRPTLGEGTW